MTADPVNWADLDREVAAVRAESERLDAEKEQRREAARRTLADRARRATLASAELAAAVKAARAAGVTWAAIGEELGITRQAAHDRWANR